MSGISDDHLFSSTIDTQLEKTKTSQLRPWKFFVAYNGVLTLCYAGFTEAILDLKELVSKAHPALPTENSGSTWPKTSIACLYDDAKFTKEQFLTVQRICHEMSAQHFSPAKDCPLVTVDSAALVLYECRSLEKMLSAHVVKFKQEFEMGPVKAAETERVRTIVDEADEDAYYETGVNRKGHRYSHYKEGHIGATLMHPLQFSWGGVELNHGSSSPASFRAALALRGFEEAADRAALLVAVQELKERIEAKLPGLYYFFDPASLHITLRGLIN